LRSNELRERATLRTQQIAPHVIGPRTNQLQIAGDGSVASDRKRQILGMRSGDRDIGARFGCAVAALPDGTGRAERALNRPFRTLVPIGVGVALERSAYMCRGHQLADAPLQRRREKNIGPGTSIGIPHGPELHAVPPLPKHAVLGA